MSAEKRSVCEKNFIRVFISMGVLRNINLYTTMQALQSVIIQ